jgi:SAM-dependent methyltransferase
MPLADDSMDFGYSLGVLHHVPDTQQGLQRCVDKLKPGAPFLVYLYYRFDGRPLWFRLLWKSSDLVRRVVAYLPHPARYAASQLLAAFIYWPLARAAAAAEKAGAPVGSWPLSYYRDKSFYTMRTDALDRFGTRLEQRFTRSEIEMMMEQAGLTDICFSNRMPFWCAVGTKKR